MKFDDILNHGIDVEHRAKKSTKGDVWKCFCQEGSFEPSYLAHLRLQAVFYNYHIRSLEAFGSLLECSL